jgi:hypothetical protein
MLLKSRAVVSVVAPIPEFETTEIPPNMVCVARSIVTVLLPPDVPVVIPAIPPEGTKVVLPVKPDATVVIVSVLAPEL